MLLVLSWLLSAGCLEECGWRHCPVLDVAVVSHVYYFHTLPVLGLVLLIIGGILLLNVSAGISEFRRVARRSARVQSRRFCLF